MTEEGTLEGKKGLIVTPDVGVLSEPVRLPPFGTAILKIPEEVISSATARLGDQSSLEHRDYPLLEEEKETPWTTLVRRYLTPSLRSRLERSGINMDKMEFNLSGDLDILLANHGPGEIIFNPERIFRFYGYQDKKLSQFTRAFCGLSEAIFQPLGHDYPSWAESFFDSNPELRQYIFRGQQKGINPLVWSVQVGWYNALAFVLPLESSYVMTPGASVDLSKKEGSDPDSALGSYKYQVTLQSLSEISKHYGKKLVQVTSQSPEVLMPENLYGIVLAVATDRKNLFRQPFHTAGISFDPNLLPWPINLPHGDSNLIDPRFHDSIATEHLVGPETQALPHQAALFIMPTVT